MQKRFLPRVFHFPNSNLLTMISRGIKDRLTPSSSENKDTQQQSSQQQQHFGQQQQQYGRQRRHSGISTKHLSRVQTEKSQVVVTWNLLTRVPTSHVITNCCVMWLIHVIDVIFWPRGVFRHATLLNTWFHLSGSANEMTSYLEQSSQNPRGNLGGKSGGENREIRKRSLSDSRKKAWTDLSMDRKPFS